MNVDISKASPQQMAVYRAEAKCNRGDVFPDHEAAQKYVHWLMSRDWWTERNYSKSLGRRGISVESIQGDWSIASPTDAVIGLSKHGLTVRTVLHEVTHCIVGSDAGHQGPFVRTLLELTYLVRGGEAYAELNAAFLAEGADIG